MVFPVVGGTQDTGYEISNSLRFNDGDSPDLRRTPSSGGDRRTFTFSPWVKKSIIDYRQTLFSVGNSNNDTDYFHFTSGNKLAVVLRSGGTTSTEVQGPALHRDPSAWLHCVMRVDSTQGTDSNRVRIYVNGSEITYDVTTYPSQNTQFETNDTKLTTVGARSRASVEHFLDGYMADTYFCDGQSYAPSEFGETNDNGVWIPKKADVTFGTNGFKLEYKQTGTGTASSSTIGADTSGNDNHLTSTNLAATDVTEDTPTNNFATLNIVNKYASPVVAEGALEYDSNSSSGSSLV